MLNINLQIAQHLNCAPCDLKSVEEWHNCFFVRFVLGSPRFVSKRVVKPEPAVTVAIPVFANKDSRKHRVQPLPKPEFETYQVMARTAIRHGWLGSENRGLKVKNLSTKEITWINNYRPHDKDINRGDFIRFDGKDIQVIRDGMRMLLSF
ncbi:hypothetical protein [Myxosarcina sp. GI1]|uniref:hypothetical protein n=1 Tax=Myxosarcina sp. GI1 TaxID=1541065 RepID=UPI00055C019C|nr:hypothetical protein [Myxosarcina sp. GI1]